MDTPRQIRESNEAPKHSTEFSDTLKYEMAVTAATLKGTLTELMILGYIEALSDLTPERIRRGFKRARRILDFFPSPNEVRECAAAEFEEFQAYYKAPIEEPEWTVEERQTWIAEIEKVCKGKKF